MEVNFFFISSFPLYPKRIFQNVMLIHAVHGNANNSDASHTGVMSALQIQGVTAVHRSICLACKAVQIEQSKKHLVGTQELKPPEFCGQCSARHLVNVHKIHKLEKIPMCTVSLAVLVMYSINSSISELVTLSHFGLREGKVDHKLCYRVCCQFHSSAWYSKCHSSCRLAFALPSLLPTLPSV